MMRFVPAPAKHAKQRRAAGRPGRAGLPGRLKSGIEALSGVAMDDVRVSYDSPAVEPLGAAAFAQGRAIHLAPGEERHLPHEAWHVVQQKQRRVPAMGHIDGTPINTDPALEREADVMGRRAEAGWSAAAVPGVHRPMGGSGQGAASPTVAPIQGKFQLPGGPAYTTLEQAKKREATIRANIPEPLPNGITEDAVLEGVYVWAEDSIDHNYFKSWAALIKAVIDALPPTGMDLDYFAPYTPTWSSPTSAPPTPTVSDYNDLGRRMSDDFSAAFKAEFGTDTAEARESKVKFTDPSDASGTTYGPGRFMSLTGPKVLGDTLYAKFLRKLPALTGLSQADLTQGLLDGLFDGEAFKTLLKGLNDVQKQALTATVRLFVNEIVNRSSVNLIELVGVLQRSLTDPSKSFDERLLASGLFVPVAKEHKGVGGQQLSRSHHEGSTVLARADSDLKETHRSNLKAIGHLANKSGVDLEELGDRFKLVTEAFIANLKEHWGVDIT